MAEVSVRYYGMLKEISGKRNETIEINDSATLSDLVALLTQRHGKKFHDFVFDQDGEIRGGIAFAANGDSIASSKLKKTKCSTVREFVILPPISGG